MYIVYETTNLVNGKFYIGVHKDNGRNYFGSGILLKKTTIQRWCEKYNIPHCYSVKRDKHV